MAEKIRPISGFANHPIDLFGAKAESENLLSLIESVTGRSIVTATRFSGEFVEISSRAMGSQAR